MAQPTTTRRGAIALAGAAAAVSTLPAPCSIAETWRRAIALRIAIDTRREQHPDDEADLSRLFAMETDVLVGPIRDRMDAVAKLSAVELCFDRGTRNDNLDEAAMRDAIEWLAAS